MVKSLGVFATILLSILSMCSQVNRQYMQPSSSTGQVVHHETFSLSYSEAHEQAEWVFYELGPSDLTERVSRTNNYRPDPYILTGSAESSDYRRSGYSRGHLLPAADRSYSYEAMSETFYFSNMSPQSPEFNGGVWLRLERKVRDWAKREKHLYVATGPILGSRALDRIGKNQVEVPRFFYKAILDLEEPTKKAIAFLVPHRESRDKLGQFAVSVDELEKMTGIDFFPDLPDSLEQKIEGNFSPQAWFSPKELPVLEEITASEARRFVGKTCKVCGTVVSTNFTENTYINLDRAYPKQVFTAVIFKDHRKNFSYAPEKYLYRKRICVEGKVQLYKDSPQILLRHPKQLELR